MACCSDGKDADTEPDAESASRWMTNLPEIKKSIPLSQLCIPGSHDSFTYSLTKDDGIANDQPKWLRDLDTGPIRRIVYNWSVTQDYSCSQQLKAGVRYFDFRVSRPCGRGGDKFRIVHGLYGAEVDKILDELMGFLAENDQEVVLLDFNHFYNMDISAHRRLVQSILSKCSSKLYPRADSAPSLNQLISQKKQIICFYQLAGGEMPGLLWNAAAIKSPWANTDDGKKLLEFLGDGLKTRKDLERFYVTQGILTPRMEDVVKRFFGTLKNCLGIPTTKSVLKWLCQVSPRTRVNIVICDFVDISSFCETVISFNHSA